MRKKPETMTVPCSGCGLPHEVPKGPYLASRKWGKRPNYHTHCLKKRVRVIPVGKPGENKGLAYRKGNEYAS